MLAHEAELTVDEVVEAVSEEELLAEVDAHLNGDFDVLAVAAEGFDDVQ